MNGIEHSYNPQAQGLLFEFELLILALVISIIPETNEKFPVYGLLFNVVKRLASGAFYMF